MSASSTSSAPIESTSARNQSSDLSNSPPPRPNRPKPNRLKLTYDIVMIIAISIDLLLIGIDAILMSGFSRDAAQWLTLSEALNWYQSHVHDSLRTSVASLPYF